jgi:hypothetical protein
LECSPALLRWPATGMKNVGSPNIQNGPKTWGQPGMIIGY